LKRITQKEISMPDDPYDTDLMKWIAAELYFLAGMYAAREMYGKSYFSLGAVEKGAVDQIVLGQVGSNFQALTPELLNSLKAKTAAPPPNPVGFRVPSAPAQSSGSPPAQ
jgi:hypothetical protein